MAGLGIALRGLGKALMKSKKKRTPMEKAMQGIAFIGAPTVAILKSKKNKPKLQKKFGPPGGKKYPKHGAK